MRLLPALLLVGCFEADRIVVTVQLDAKKDRVPVRELLDNVWPDAVDCGADSDLAACVEGVRKAMQDPQWTHASAKVTEGSLDIAYEGEMTIDQLQDIGIWRIGEVRPHGARDRLAILAEPKPNESVAIDGRWRRYDYAEGDTHKSLWVLLGRRHTVTMEWHAMDDGNVQTAPRWVTPEIEEALRGAGLLVE